MRKINTPLLSPVLQNKAALFFALAFLPVSWVHAQKTKSDTLKETKIDEVVMIGYGAQKKTDINSAVSSIKSKDIQDLKQVSVDQMLQGKVAGVSVTNGNGQPGAAASVRVRGTTSISSSNEPLYIIDGVPISGDATNSSTTGRPIAGNDTSATGGSGNAAVSPLTFLNPNDIESIDVLKDASATAIYGSRGANGVIIITTKSGKKGAGKISYEGYTSVSSIYKYLDVMNLQQYARYQNQLSELFNLQPRPEFAHPELLGNGTNWQKAIYKTAFSQSHQLSFSGGKDNTTFYISANYLNQEGNIINTGLKRYTFRTNVDSQVNNWLKVGTNVTGGVSNENFTVNQSYNGLISNTLLQAPDMPIYNFDGSYASPPAGQNVNYFNPVAEALTNTNKLIRKNFLGNLYAEAKITKGLKYRMELSANTEFSENTEFHPSYDRGSQFNLIADLYVRNQDWYSVNFKNLLTYDFSLGKNKFTILAGQEAQDVHYKGFSSIGQGFKSNDVYGLNLADDVTTTSFQGSNSLSSLFGRIIYDFDGRYSLTASIRADRSSKFDPEADNGKKQLGYFPAVSASWRVTKEKFMEWIPSNIISNIRFRGGYGETGNQNIPNNRYTSLLTIYNLVGNLSNKNLKWESMQQTNIGVDLTLLKRLNIALDWYNKKSKDFLFQAPLPSYVTGGANYYGGIDAMYSNIGSMVNRGIDLNISYETKGEKFNWTSNLVVSRYRNKLLSLADGLSDINTQVNLNGYLPMVATNTLIGEPVGVFWGYKTNDLYRTADQLNNAPTQFGTAPKLGDVRYVDVNGDGKINESDMTIIGNPHPDFTFGFTNTFRYKNVDLSVFVQGSVGNDILNLTKRNGTMNSQLYQNQLVGALDYWTPNNPNASLPRPVADNNSTNLLISDRFVEKGDYLRIQNVTLGYTVSPTFASQLKLTRFRIYVSAQNLFTITKYSGYDPEIGSFNQNVLLTGVDNGRYPSPRTFNFGVNLDF